LEEDWDTKTIGFFTQVFPSGMTNKYATKVVSKSFNHATSRHLVPHFRIQSIPMRVTDSKTVCNTRVFGLEVKSQDVRSIVDSSEVETLRAEVKRYQEELESYSNKMEKFQDLLESILIQVGKLSVPPPDSTDNKGFLSRREAT
jgi:hypothetical protein